MSAPGLVQVGVRPQDMQALDAGLRKALGKIKGLDSQVKLATSKAINNTAKWMTGRIAKNIASEVAIKQRDIKRYIHVSKARRSKLEAVVTLEKSKRIQLIYFGAREARKGVTYRISRKGSRKYIPGAFVMTRGKSQLAGAGGQEHRFVTRRLGKARLPVANPLRGPSAWGVFVVNKMKGPTIARGMARLRKEMREQIRLATILAKRETMAAPVERMVA